MLVASLLCAGALLSAEARSAHSRGLPPSPYQEQTADEGPLMGRSDLGPESADLDERRALREQQHQLQLQATDRFSRETPDESDEADSEDEAASADSSEESPMRGLSAAAPNGEEVDASELSPLGGSQMGVALGGLQGDFAASKLQAASNSHHLQQQQRRQQNPARGRDVNNSNDSDDSDSLADNSDESGDESDGQPSVAPAALGGAGPMNENAELGLDTNIANAKIDLSPRDMSTAAGHHYHGHGVHGMLKMGAETGKKGAFKWYDKHPVGGKGRR